jgi:hypothetical protein
LVNQFQFDIGQLAADVKVNVSKITTLVKELGCRTGTKKDKKALLQLPLKFPKKTR